MSMTDDLLTCARAYCEARQIALPTLSGLVLRDSRTFDRVAAGGSMTVRNMERSMQWLSDHWPDDRAWPAHVVRPSKSAALEVA